MRARVTKRAVISLLLCLPATGAGQQEADVVPLAGGADATDVVLTAVRGMVVHDDGILLLDRHGGVVSLSHGGELEAVWGRTGQGPGEFRTPARIGLIGDSIWVADPALNRVTFFDRSGTPLSTSDRRSPALGSGLDPGLPATILVDGSFLATPRYDIDRAIDQTTGIPLLLVTRRGRVDTLAFQEAARQWWRIPFRGSVLTTASPFATLSLHDASASGEHLAWVIDRGGSFVVSVLDVAAGGIATFSVAYEPQLVTDALIDRLVADRVGAIMADFGTLIGSRQRLATAAHQSIPQPDHLPPVTAVVVAADGASVWLRREATSTDEVRWEHYRRDGVELGRIVLPVAVEVHSAWSGSLWGTVPDALDVPVIVRIDTKS